MWTEHDVVDDRLAVLPAGRLDRLTVLLADQHRAVDDLPDPRFIGRHPPALEAIEQPLDQARGILGQSPGVQGLRHLQGEDPGRDSMLDAAQDLGTSGRVGIGQIVVSLGHELAGGDELGRHVEIADLERPTAQHAEATLPERGEPGLLDEPNAAAMRLEPALMLGPQPFALALERDEIHPVPAGGKKRQEMGYRQLVTAGHRQGWAAVEEKDIELHRRRIEPHRPRHAVITFEGPGRRHGGVLGRRLKH